MKHLTLILPLALVACFNVTNSCSQPIRAGSDVLGIFVASTPCNEGSRPLPGIPAKADCDFIIWRLTLYHNPNSSTPTIYKLKYTHGLSQASTPGFIGGGTKVEMEGKWSVVRGAGPGANATVYELDTGKRNPRISLLKLSDNLLHLLDSDKRLMIGNAGYSYTLNKMKESSF